MFRYTSACPLATPRGVMRGAFEFLDLAGDNFDVLVDKFGLDVTGSDVVEFDDMGWEGGGGI